MRHVPEEELHACLDQALSRSQCIEIETHLACCLPCSQARDEIAALRDRTTALVALAAPPLQWLSPPPAVELLTRAEARRRSSWRRRAAWAAGIGVTIAAGWGARALVGPQTAESDRLAMAARVEAPAAVPAPVTSPRPPEDAVADASPPPPVIRLAVSGGPEPPVVAAPGPLLERLPETPEAPEAPITLGAGWLPATLDEAERATKDFVPLLPDLPIVAVRLRGAGPAQRPLVLVTQRDPSGTPLHTVEGPVGDVADVVAAQLDPARHLNSSEPSRSAPDYLEPDGSGPVRRTHRVLVVIGRLTVDSLNALSQVVVMR